MPGLSAIRDALETQLGTVTGLKVYSDLPQSVACPAAVAIPDKLDFDQAMGGGLNMLMLDVYVLVDLGGATGERQSDLDALLDPAGTTSTSVLAAIRTDPSLGGVVSSAHVTSWDGYGGTYGAGGAANKGAVVHLEIGFTES